MRRVLAIMGLLLVVVFTSCSKGDPGSKAAAGTTTSPRATVEPTTTEPVLSTPGCGRPADARPVSSDLPGDVEESLTLDGTERDYRLGVPDGYDPDRATPLVVNLHGSGSNALEASIYSDVAVEGDDRGMLTVTPDAIGGKWQLGASGTDHDFLMALVENIESRYCVDTDRVFLIGMSLGAWKAAVTACAAPDTFAAAALVTVEVHPPECPPLPVVAFHGTADVTVPYGEGSGHEFPHSPNAGLPGTRENIAHWVEGNGCDPEPVEERIGDDVEWWTFRDCAADLELYTVIGGGHTWPGASVEIGPTTQTIDATDIAFDWFENHRRTG